MVFDGISKGVKDPVMEQMVDEATKVLEAVADKLWVSWANHLIPNVSHWVKVEAVVRAWDEQDCKI